MVLSCIIRSKTIRKESCPIITTSITLKEDFHSHVLLGRSGEHHARQLLIDLSYFVSTFGDGTAYLLHRRNGDAEAYPAAITREGNTVSWIITRSDNAIAGHGTAELQWYVNDTVAKSILFETITSASMDCSVLTEAPTPQTAWSQQVLDAAEELRTQAAEMKEHYIAAESMASDIKTACDTAASAQKTADNAQAAASAAVKTVHHIAPDAGGNVTLSSATMTELTAGTSTEKLVTPSNLTDAVFTGLAKASQSQLQYSAQDKQRICQLFGLNHTILSAITAPTMSTTGINPSLVANRFTVQNGGYAVCGKFVHVGLHIRINFSPSSDEMYTLIARLPAPAFGHALSAAFPLADSYERTTAYIDTAGVIFVWLPKSFPSGSEAFISGTYLLP